MLWTCDEQWWPNQTTAQQNDIYVTTNCLLIFPVTNTFFIKANFDDYMMVTQFSIQTFVY